MGWRREWVPRCCPRAARGVVRLGSTALPLRSAGCREIGSCFNPFFLPPFVRPWVPKHHSPRSHCLTPLSRIAHHLQDDPCSVWCCADRSGSTQMVPYTVTRRVSSAATQQWLAPLNPPAVCRVS